MSAYDENAKADTYSHPTDLHRDDGALASSVLTDPVAQPATMWAHLEYYALDRWHALSHLLMHATRMGISDRTVGDMSRELTNGDHTGPVHVMISPRATFHNDDDAAPVEGVKPPADYLIRPFNFVTP